MPMNPIKSRKHAQSRFNQHMSAALAAMLLFIGLNEANAKKADADAPRRSKLFGQLTAVAFAVVIFAAVFAFN